MLRRIIITTIFLFMSQIVYSAVDEEGYNEYTIRPSDIPIDAPRFEDYPAKTYHGPNAAPDLLSHPRSREYRTRLKVWAHEKPNFAGHFILATWECGAECTEIAIIDVQTGKVFHPPGATYNAAVNVHDALLQPVGDIWHSSGAIWYRVDSKLLVMIGMPEERIESRGISYYVWKENHLKKICFVPKAWYPEKNKAEQFNPPDRK